MLTFFDVHFSWPLSIETKFNIVMCLCFLPSTNISVNHFLLKPHLTLFSTRDHFFRWACMSIETLLNLNCVIYAIYGPFRTKKFWLNVLHTILYYVHIYRQLTFNFAQRDIRYMTWKKIYLLWFIFTNVLFWLSKFGYRNDS